MREKQIDKDQKPSKYYNNYKQLPKKYLDVPQIKNKSVQDNQFTPNDQQMKDFYELTTQYENQSISTEALENNHINFQQHFPESQQKYDQMLNMIKTFSNEIPQKQNQFRSKVYDQLAKTLAQIGNFKDHNSQQALSQSAYEWINKVKHTNPQQFVTENENTQHVFEKQNYLGILNQQQQQDTEQQNIKNKQEKYKSEVYTDLKDMQIMFDHYLLTEQKKEYQELKQEQENQRNMQIWGKEKSKKYQYRAFKNENKKFKDQNKQPIKEIYEKNSSMINVLKQYAPNKLKQHILKHEKLEQSDIVKNSKLIFKPKENKALDKPQLPELNEENKKKKNKKISETEHIQISYGNQKPVENDLQEFEKFDDEFNQKKIKNIREKFKEMISYEQKQIKYNFAYYKPKPETITSLSINHKSNPQRKKFRSKIKNDYFSITQDQYKDVEQIGKRLKDKKIICSQKTLINALVKPQGSEPDKKNQTFTAGLKLIANPYDNYKRRNYEQYM